MPFLLSNKNLLIARFFGRSLSWGKDSPSELFALRPFIPSQLAIEIDHHPYLPTIWKSVKSISYWYLIYFTRISHEYEHLKALRKLHGELLILFIYKTAAYLVSYIYYFIILLYFCFHTYAPLIENEGLLYQYFFTILFILLHRVRSNWSASRFTVKIKQFSTLMLKPHGRYFRHLL